MIFIGEILLFAVEVYFWIIILSVVISWLIAFEVINTKNQQAVNLTKLLDRATEPVYKPIKKYVPPIGGIDITPIVVLFGLHILTIVITNLFIY